MFFIESAIFLLSTLSILILAYFHIANNVFQQITAFLLALTLIFLTRLIFPHSQLLQGRKLRLLLLFLSSALVQFLVISTGGFYSPFLILFHLYTLGASFFLTSRSPISFIVFALIALSINILINEELMNLFRQDPGPIILYVISFAVVIPLAQFLIYSYHLKDALFNALKEYIRIREKREESILKGLKELVVVTDENLNIVSTNEAVLETTGLLENEIIHHPLLKIFPLKESGGNLVEATAFSQERIFLEKVTFTLNNLYLQTKTDSHPRKVAVQIRPIANSQGQVRQIVFIISDALISNSQDRYTNLELAKQRHTLLVNDLQKTFLNLQQRELFIKVTLLGKLEEDLLLATEIESRLLEEPPKFYDLAYLAQQILSTKHQFAATLGVLLVFDLQSLSSSEQAMLSLIKTNLPEQQLPTSEFLIPLKKRGFEIVLHKLLDIAIFLASEKVNSTVKLTPLLIDNTMLGLQITLPYHQLTTEEKEELFKEYYGRLGANTGLRLSSGLEGFIAQAVTNQLNFRIEVNFLPHNSSCVFLLKLPKVPTD